MGFRPAHALVSQIFSLTCLSLVLFPTYMVFFSPIPLATLLGQEVSFSGAIVLFLLQCLILGYIGVKQSSPISLMTSFVMTMKKL